MPDPVIEIFHKDWQNPVELTRDEATELMHELKDFLEVSGPHLTVKHTGYKGVAIRKKSTRIRRVS